MKKLSRPYLLLILLPLIILQCGFNTAYARFATHEEAAVDLELHNTEVIVRADGTADYIVEEKSTILKEVGRDRSSYVITYNAASEKVEIIEAKTIYQGKEYKIPEDQIENQPIASSPNGFDETYQILLSYPKVEIGSSIYIKYRLIETKPDISGVFGRRFFFGNGNKDFWKSAFVKINSELPLNLKINDPDNALEVKKDSLEKSKEIKIELKKPIMKSVVDEPSNAILTPEKEVWISVSSVDSWEELASKIGVNYSKTFSQELPKMLQNVLQAATKEKNSADKINTVTSLLIDKINYMGDWRSVDGAFYPRSLEDITSSQIGDCKDFSAATAAILQKLGFKVQFALVTRGVGSFGIEESLPTMYNFNHVFLKVTDKKGIVYWVDPTNISSMAQGMFRDIAGKMVLIIDPSDPKYERAPEIDFNNSKVKIMAEMNFKAGGITSSGTISFFGEAAEYFTAIGLYKSKKQIRDLVFLEISGRDLKESSKEELIIPDLKSRIVKDFSIRYKFNSDLIGRATNMGIGINGIANREKYRIFNDITRGIQDQVTDLFIGLPVTIESHLTLKNIHPENLERLNYENDTPWFSMKRVFNYKGKDTEMIETIIVKKSKIPNAEVIKQDYKKLVRDITENFRDALLIIPYQEGEAN